MACEADILRGFSWSNGQLSSELVSKDQQLAYVRAWGNRVVLSGHGRLCHAVVCSYA
jgi:hypothetical protein